MQLLTSLLYFPLLTLVNLVNGQTAPTVTISSPEATIIGTASASIESFSAIPFAQPPTGSLRLNPPQAISTALGTIEATAAASACPQFILQVDTSDIPEEILAELIDSPLVQTTIVDASEDCLTLDIKRPAGTTPDSKLPVLFWIFGGAFALGETSTYDLTSFVAQSIEDGLPILAVSVNYRVGGFRFLPGKEVLEAGASNLGLLDQRLGLQWVADNIAAFGGDPSKVTIWGESAGAISVFDQMILYNGDNTYNYQPLFRGAIMDSGSIVPTEPIDGPKGQNTYDNVVAAAGCDNEADTLDCLRNLDYTTLLNAVNSVPSFLGYQSPSLQYQPRPDGTIITDSPQLMLQAGNYTKIPFIIGDQEDEGTLFSIFQYNITDTDELVTFWNTVTWQEASLNTVQGMIDTYPDDPDDGAPFRTGILWNWYPEYKRFAAIMGDTTFTMARRLFLDITSSLNPDIPSWSYLCSTLYGLPFLGTLHRSDLLFVLLGDVEGYATDAWRSYYCNFIYDLNPNGNASSSYINWPQWSEGQELLWFESTASMSTLADDFRNESYAYYAANVNSLLV